MRKVVGWDLADLGPSEDMALDRTLRCFMICVLTLFRRF